MHHSEQNPEYSRAEAESALQTALQLFEEGLYEDALQQADLAIRLAPDLVEPYRLRWAIHQLRGDSQSAIAELDQILRLVPNDVDALQQRALAHMSLDQPTLALADFDNAIAHHPYLAKGATKVVPNDPQSMIFDRTERDELTTFHTVEENLGMLYSWRSAALKRLGRDEEARAAMRQCLQLALDAEEIDSMDNAELVRGLNKRGKKLLEAGNYPAAIQACSAALLQAPENCEARAQRGIAYHMTGEHEKAGVDLMEAWRLKELRDRTAKGYLVTTDRFRPEEVITLYPYTPDGRAEATSLLADLARDNNLREQVLGEYSSVHRFRVYLVVGKEIKQED